MQTGEYFVVNFRPAGRDPAAIGILLWIPSAGLYERFLQDWSMFDEAEREILELLSHSLLLMAEEMGAHDLLRQMAEWSNTLFLSDHNSIEIITPQLPTDPDEPFLELDQLFAEYVLEHRV